MLTDDEWESKFKDWEKDAEGNVYCPPVLEFQVGNIAGIGVMVRLVYLRPDLGRVPPEVQPDMKRSVQVALSAEQAAFLSADLFNAGLACVSPASPGTPKN